MTVVTLAAASPNGSPGIGRRVRLHVQNRPNDDPTFTVSERWLTAACARHHALACRLDITIADTEDGFDRHMADAEILIAHTFPHRDLGKRAPLLRWIYVYSAGIERFLPLDWLPHGVHLVNGRGLHAAKVGEYAAMALMLLNMRVPALVSQQARGCWNPLYSSRLAGKTVLVVGLGALGRAVVAAAGKLGMIVLGLRASGRASRGVAQMFQPTELHQALGLADFVVVAVPLTPATRGLIDAPALSRMRRGAGVVNISRGGTIDEPALCAALRDGQIGGAVLDVVVNEPLPRDSPLWHTPNLVITPHLSAHDPDHFMPAALDLFFDNLGRHLDGRALRNRVSRRRGY